MAQHSLRILVVVHALPLQLRLVRCRGRHGDAGGGTSLPRPQLVIQHLLELQHIVASGAHTVQHVLGVQRAVRPRMVKPLSRRQNRVQHTQHVAVRSKLALLSSGG